MEKLFTINCQGKKKIMRKHVYLRLFVDDSVVIAGGRGCKGPEL